MSLETVIQQHKQTLGNKYIGQMEILTPVHIGSGVKLTQGIDFWTDNNRTYIVEQEKLMEYLSKLIEDNPNIEPDEIKDFSGTDRNKRYAILKKVGASKTYNFTCSTSEISEFERDGNGKPYLPGSSIKGAIRTALYSRFYNQLPLVVKDSQLNNLGRKPQWAADNLSKKLMGEDSNHDFMRSLVVGDAFFKESDFELKETHVLKHADRTGNSSVWKKINRTENRMIVTAEMLRPQVAKSHFNLRFDNFLLNREFFGNKTMNLEILCSVINEHSRHLLEIDSIYFDKLKPKQQGSVATKGQQDNPFAAALKAFGGFDELDSVRQQITYLKSLIPQKDTPQYKSSFILPIGWGIGWGGMTGAFLKNSEINNLRERGIIKQGTTDFLFPKSRKIVFQNNTPQYLSGWVKITLA